MKVINIKEEFENFFPYAKKYIKEYPKEYPCIAKLSLEGGGIMGDYWELYIAYYPKKVLNLIYF